MRSTLIECISTNQGKITVWQLAMGIYIPLPYCHRDMILGIARKFHDSMWLEWVSKEVREQLISLCF